MFIDCIAKAQKKEAHIQADYLSHKNFKGTCIKVMYFSQQEIISPPKRENILKEWHLPATKSNLYKILYAFIKICFNF